MQYILKVIGKREYFRGFIPEMSGTAFLDSARTEAKKFSFHKANKMVRTLADHYNLECEVQNYHD